jgi:hypothetical protein
VARIARDGHNSGMAPAAILLEIEKVTGPASQAMPPQIFPRTPERYRANFLWQLAGQIASMRRFLGDERTVYTVMAWTQTRLPQFRRL